ncbi:MAG TPA: ATP-binding protein, partial [Isosphaeraceae bacterium]
LNEQLAQVGRLLAGIIHEIRGPLSVIRGNAELMRMSLGEEDTSKQWVAPIIRACQLLQVRLEHLMAAVRGGPAVLQDLDLIPLTSEAAELFQKGIDPRRGQVTIHTEFSVALPPVRADAGRMIQVLLNLLSNAHEAILAVQGQGRITVRTDLAREDDRDWILVEVLDDGPGIPEHLLGRIFEPFFSTKDEGSGYGLYLASEILREHAGRLTARNAPGGGACFTLWLPPAPPSSPGSARGTPTEPGSRPDRPSA